MNNTITEMKNKLEGINRRINEAEEQISELEDRLVKITAMKWNKENRSENTRGESKRLMEHHQTQQHEHYRGPRRRREGLRKCLKR